MKRSDLPAAGAAVIAAYPRLLFAERNSAGLLVQRAGPHAAER